MADVVPGTISPSDAGFDPSDFKLVQPAPASGQPDPADLKLVSPPPPVRSIRPTAPEQPDPADLTLVRPAAAQTPNQPPPDPGTIGPDTRSTLRRGLDYVEQKLSPLTGGGNELSSGKGGFPMPTAQDISQGNWKVLLPGVDPETGNSVWSLGQIGPPTSTAAKVAAGAARGVIGTANSVIPWAIGGPAMEAGSFIPMSGRIASLAFGADMLHHLPDQAKSFISAVQNGDVQGATETGVGTALGAYFGYKAIEHGVARTAIPQVDAQGQPLMDPATGKQQVVYRGVLDETPAIKDLLTKKIVETYPPDVVKDVMTRVLSQQPHTPAEAELVRFITDQTDSPGEAGRKGVAITTSDPVIKSQFWRDYLGLKPGEKTLSILGQAPGEGGQPAQPTAQPTGAPNASPIKTTMGLPGDQQAEGTPPVSAGESGELPKPAATVEPQAPPEETEAEGPVTPPAAKPTVGEAVSFTPRQEKGVIPVPPILLQNPQNMTGDPFNELRTKQSAAAKDLIAKLPDGIYEAIDENGDVALSNVEVSTSKRGKRSFLAVGVNGVTDISDGSLLTPGPVQTPEGKRVWVPGMVLRPKQTTAIPPLPSTDIPVKIKDDQGNVYDAGFNGYQPTKIVGGKDAGFVPTFSVMKPGSDAWTTGSPLPQGHQIVAGNIPKAPVEPQATPAPESTPAPNAPDQEILNLIQADVTPQAKAAGVARLAKARNVSVKEMQEQIEQQVVRLADHIVRNPDLISPQAKVARLLGLYRLQPTLSARTSTSVQNQAYSTPAPLAYLMNYAVGAIGKAMYEPTAGNGMLMIGTDLKNSAANEFNGDRFKALKQHGIGTVTAEDATTFRPKGMYPVVASNPPFGTIDNVNYQGYGIKKLEHLIALRALEHMAPDGHGYMILGANMKEAPTAKGAQWVFENYVYGHYNVVANFELEGDLYAKQGAKWPVRVLVVDGRRAEPIKGDLAPKTVTRFKTWGEVLTEAERIHNEIAAKRQAVGTTGPAGLPVRPGTGGAATTDAGGVSDLPGTTAPKTPVRSIRGGKGGRQPTVTAKPAGGVPGPATGQAPVGQAGGQLPDVQPGGGGQPVARVEGGVGRPGQPAANVPGGSQATGGGVKPGVVPKPPVVSPRGAGDLEGLSDAELDSMLDEAQKAEPTTQKEQAAAKAPSKGTAQTKNEPQKELSAAQIAKAAAKQGVTGIDEAMKGLHDLFGGGTHMGTFGPGFDEKTYAKAKPHFREAYDQFKAAGKSLGDFLKFVFEKFGQAIREYVKRFVKEVQAETSDEPVEQPPEQKPKQPTKVATTEYQVNYEPRSEGTPFGTLTPKNIAEGTHGALDALQAKVGPIDEFVANRLNMKPSEVRQVMAAEQIDGVALALDQIENEGALIIGDETGIGKGRQAAAVIRNGILQGKVVIFFTKDPKLFSDMHGDLQDIHTQIKPLIFGDVGKATIVDPDGKVMFRAPSKPVQDREMARIEKDGWEKSGYNVIFSTYSQVNNRNARQQFLEKLAKENPTYVVLDEAHEAAGDNDTSMQAAFISGGTIKRGKGADIKKITVPGLLNQAGTKQGQGGVLYLSATYAKRPENMPVYFRTALSKAAQSFSQITDAMKRGGVALQQAVSEALAKAGQYVRRERDFTGVSFRSKEVKVHDATTLVDHVDQVTDVLSEIVRFSHLLRDMVKDSGDADSTAMTQSQTDMTDFAAIVHNQVGQLLLAAKADAVVDEALAAHHKGEKPVIALMNTMESFLDSYVEDHDIKPDQPMQLRWNELLKHALDRSLRATTKLPNGNKEISVVNPDDYGLGDLYRQIQKTADGIESRFPVSPIDYILQKLNAAGVKMAELTGRESGIKYTNFETGEGTYSRFKKANKNNVVNGFNNGSKNGGYDGMLLNASGSTGLSAHASMKFRDQSPRHMIIAQAALDINVFIQTLGRIKRTGMVMLGKGEDGQPYGAKYTHLVLPLQAELRPAAMAAKKMKSLNANTTSGTDNAIKIDAEDLFNRYGDGVVTDYLDQHPEFQSSLGLPVDEKEDGTSKVDPDVARRFTGRMALMPDADQKSAYEDIIPAYRQLIEQLKATNEYDLEIVVHKDWDGVQKSNDELSAGTDDSSIFTAGVRMQKWEVADHRHTPTGEEMTREFQKNLGSPEKVREGWDEFASNADRHFEARLEELNDKLAKTDEKGRGQVQSQIGIVQKVRDRWLATRDQLRSIIRDAGDVVSLTNAETGDNYDGMLVDIKYPDGTRTTPSAFRFKFLLHSPGGVAYITGSQFSPEKWTKDNTNLEPTDLGAQTTDARYERYFLTGNPIAAYNATGGHGKMVRFNSRDGQVVTGLMMPTNWGPEKLANDPRVELVSGKAVEHFLRNFATGPVEAGGLVRMGRTNRGTYGIMVPSAKSTGGKIYLDPKLLKLTGDFTKVGNRMTVSIAKEQIEKASDIIMDILKVRFRPVGKQVDTFIKQVSDSNAAGKGLAKASIETPPTPPVSQVQPPVRETEELMSPAQMLERLPESGLDARQQAVLKAVLESPVLSKLPKLQIRVLNSLGNWSGSFFDNLATLVRGADPSTAAHEILGHGVWPILPDEMVTEIGRLRRETIQSLLDDPETDALVKPLLQQLLDRPTQHTLDYQSRGFPKELDKLLYPLSSDEEFFAHSQSKFFKARVGSTQEGFWSKLKEIIKDFIAALKKLFRLSLTREQMFRNIVNGDFEINPRSGAASEARAMVEPAGPPVGAKASLESTEDTGDDEEKTGIPVQIAGRKYTVPSKEQLTPGQIATGSANAANFMRSLKIPGQADPGVVFRPTPDGFNYDSEGRALIAEVTRAIQGQYQPGGDPAYSSALVRMINYNFGSGVWSDLFSQPVADELMSISAQESSMRGQMLRAVQGVKDDVVSISRNLDFSLKRVYGDAFNGAGIQNIINTVLANFRNYFSDEEIEAALGGSDKLKELAKKLIAMNFEDSGTRVYRRAQALLKPKGKKTLAQMERDTRVEEAVNQILENLKPLGIEPKKGAPGMTPLQKLLHLVDPRTADKIDSMLSAAIESAEHNAGIRYALANAPNQAAREDLHARFSAGEEPEHAAVEAGMDLPEYEHWKMLRDNLLDYSPTTLKLIQKMIQGDFKGVQTKAPQAKPVDTRIDLNKLATSADAEVQRVLGAHIDNLQHTLDLSKATPETRARVIAMVEQEVAGQLEAARTRYRSKVFTSPVAGSAGLTADQRLANLLNAGIFRDERLDLPGMVRHVAEKGVFQRVMPKMGPMIKTIINTPFYRQAELKPMFADAMVKQYGVSPEEATKAAEVFAEAFQAKFDAAKANALKLTEQALTPVQRVDAGPKTSLWQKIVHAVNAGNFDTGDMLRRIAATKGWTVPTNADAAQMKDLAERFQKLGEPKPSEIARVQNDTSLNDQEKAQRLAELPGQKAAAFTYERAKLIKRMATKWATFSRPIRWSKHKLFGMGLPGSSIDVTRNNVAAMNEYMTLDTLLKVGLTAFRLPIHILTQTVWHSWYSPIAVAKLLRNIDISRGDQTHLWPDIWQGMKDNMTASIAALKPSLIAARAELLARGESRNVDRLLGGINAMERMAAKANEYAAAGDYARAVLIHIFNIPRLMQFYISAVDHWQGTPVEYQEMINKVVIAMREQGRSAAEIETTKKAIFGEMKTAFVLAVAQTKSFFDSEGIQASQAQIEEGAMQLVKRMIYDRMIRLGLTGDDFKADIDLLRNTVSWQVRTSRGIGGMVSNVLRGVSDIGATAGLPTVFTRLSNAIGTGINYSLMNTPFYKLAAIGGTGPENPWFMGPLNQQRRQVQAMSGTMFGAWFMLLVGLGLITVQLSYPNSKKEKDAWTAAGHRIGTFEINLPGGKFIPLSMSVGPGALMAPYLAAAGAVKNTHVAREQKQAQMNAEAAKQGLPAGKIDPLSLTDALAVAAQAASGVLMGNRTASGATQGFMELGSLNINKAVASEVSALVPGLPGFQEISRAMGVQMDPKLASVWDYLVPLPSSGARMLNLLGEPVETPDAVQRVIQTMTAGSYPFPVDPGAAEAASPYQALFQTGYMPPAINPNKGFNVNGEFRPMTGSELSQYTALRGQYLKQALTQLGPNASLQDVKAAYVSANERALSEMGVFLPSKAAHAAPRTAESAPQNALEAAGGVGAAGGATTGSSVRRFSGRSLRGRAGRGAGRGRSLGRHGSRGPSLRQGRSIRASTGRSHHAKKGRSIRA